MAGGARRCGGGDAEVNHGTPNYLEIATLTVGHRSRGLARYRDTESTIAAAAAVGFAAPNQESAIDAMERVITEAERDAETFYWDGTLLP